MSVIPSRVFVSYSSADDTLARRVVTALDSVGVVSWFAPRDIVPTRTYAGQITTAIEESEILLALITDASATNQNVLREVDLAYRNNKTLLPVIVTAGGIGPDLDYYFGPLHHIISTPDQVAEDVGRHFSQPAIVELHARESDDIPDVEVGATVSTSPTSTPTPTLDDVDTKWSQGELHMRGGDPRLAAADFREALSLLSRVDGDTTRQQATIRGLLIAALKEQLAEAEPDLQAAPTLPILRELSALLGDHYGESAGSALGARVALAEALDEAGEATESHEILLQVTSTDATVSAALSNDLLRAHYHLAVHAVRGRDFSSALQAFSALRPVMTVRHPLRPLLDGLDHWEQRARTEAGVLTVPFGHRMEDIFNEWKTLPPSGEVVESLEYPDIDSVWDADERHLDSEACLPVVKTSASSATPSGREITSTFHVVGSNTDTTSGVPGKPRLMFRQATRMVWRFRLDQLTAALPGESRAARLDLYLHRRVPSTTFATFSAVVRGADGHWTALEQPVTAADGFIAVLLKSVEVDGTVHEVQPQEDGTIRFEVELSTSETGHPRWCEVAFLTTSPNFSAFALARIAEGEDHHMYSSSVPIGTDSAITVRAFYGNVGSRVQNNVVAVASLPKSVELVPSTTSITNSNQPHGLAASDNLTSRGINFGNYGPNTNAAVDFLLRTDPNMSKGTVAGIELAVIEIETDNGSRFGTVALVRGESRHTPEGDGARISFMGSESEVTWPDARLVWPDEPHAVSLPSINATTRMHLELSENLRSQSDRVIVELPRFISGGTPFPVTVFGESDGREFLVGQGLALSKAEGALASDSGTSAFTEEEHPRSRGVLRLAARTDALSASTQLSVSFTGPMSRLQGAWRSHRTATGTRVEARFVNPTHRAVHTLSLWARTAPGIVASSTTVRLSGIGQPVQLPSGQIHRAWNRPQIPVLTPKDSIDLCLEFDSPPGPWLDVLDIRLRSPLGSLSAQRVPGTM